MHVHCCIHIHRLLGSLETLMSTTLACSPFLGGAHPCEEDAVVFAFLDCYASSHVPESLDVAKQRVRASPVFVRYVDMIREKYFGIPGCASGVVCKLKDP